MNNKPKEKVRKGFTSPKGVAFLTKVNSKDASKGSAAGKKPTKTTAVRKVTPLYDQTKDKK
jgi:hypothetical protein